MPIVILTLRGKLMPVVAEIRLNSSTLSPTRIVCVRLTMEGCEITSPFSGSKRQPSQSE